MSVHPKFDLKQSDCSNCAAFHGDDEGGTCHRFAPRPTASVGHFPEGGTRTRVTEPQGVIWPRIEDELWCLDWFPRPGLTFAADESRWAEFLATLSSRARSGLKNVNSFKQLDGLTPGELWYATHIGSADEILEKRRAFPGGRVS